MKVSTKINRILHHARFNIYSNRYLRNHLNSAPYFLPREKYSFVDLEYPSLSHDLQKILFRQTEDVVTWFILYFFQYEVLKTRQVKLLPYWDYCTLPYHVQLNKSTLIETNFIMSKMDAIKKHDISNYPTNYREAVVYLKTYPKFPKFHPSLLLYSPTDKIIIEIISKADMSQDFTNVLQQLDVSLPRSISIFIEWIDKTRHEWETIYDRGMHAVSKWKHKTKKTTFITNYFYCSNKHLIYN